MYSTEYNADSGCKDIICYFTSILAWGIKGRYFHIACIEVVRCKYGKPPDEQDCANDVPTRKENSANKPKWNYYTVVYNQDQDLDLDGVGPQVDGIFFPFI